MAQALAARTLKLADLRAKFGLQRTEAADFFPEWQESLLALTAIEQQAVDRIKANYLYLLEYPVLEIIVKMVVLSPLLDLAGFYAPPFRVTGELEVKVTAADEGEVIQGTIDILALQEKFWVTVIEAKNSEFSLTKALPQGLAYMLAHPHTDRPAFGAVTNGSEFLFIKLASTPSPRYALSNTFSLLNRGNDYYQVLQILKRFGTFVQSTNEIGNL